VTETDLARIEGELNVRPPSEYRRVMAEQGDMLRAMTFRYNGVDAPYFNDDLWLRADELIGANLSEREPGSGTGYAFPKWWESFFLFATNGAGDYYALRLDGKPGVWMIGSDCGDKPTRQVKSLDEYVRRRLDAYRPEVNTPPPPPGFDDSFDPAERGWYSDWKPGLPAGERRALAVVLAAAGDDAPRRKFADWLDRSGQPQRAEFVRARCALDDQPPRPDEYPDAVEALREAAHGLDLKWPELPPGLSFFSSGHELADWWSDDADAWERGLPSFASVSPFETEDDNATARRVKRALPAVIEKTPIRGLNFEWHIPRHVASVLREPAASALTRLAFDSRPRKGQLCPVVEALKSSPVARTLTRLEIGDGLNDDGNVVALAGVPFERLRRFGTHFVGASPDAIRRLLAAPWFRRLHRLLIGFPGDGAAADGLTGMSHLHTLCLWFPTAAALKAVGRADIPALRRLFVHAADLKGDISTALAGMRSPGLVELWLRNSSAGTDDVRALLAAPWAARLQVLTVECKLTDPAVFDVLAASPCAAHLRVLRFHRNGFPRLTGTAFARPGAFPNLTSLELEHPFDPDDPSAGEVGRMDTAAFLRTLRAGRLRFLKLEGCGYDTVCEKAVRANPTLGGVKRIETGLG
jgi:uncharacterized protein (TIGR02996 family)